MKSLPKYVALADDKLTFETLDETPWPEGTEVAAEAATGTLVIFNGRAPHLSSANVSEPRHAYTHVIDKTAHYPAENWLQRRPDLPLRGFAG